MDEDVEEQLGGEGEECQEWAEEGEEQDEERFVATTNSPRPRGAFLGAMRGYRASRPLRARSRAAPAVGNVAGRMQCFNCRGYGHMAGQCPNFNPLRDSDRDVVCATCGSYGRDHVNGRCPPDLSRTRVFGATTAVAAQQASTFQPSFSQSPIPFPILLAMQRLPLLIQRRQRRETNRPKGQHRCLGSPKGRQDEAIPRRRQTR